MRALLVIDVQDEYMKKYDESLLAGINQRIQYLKNDLKRKSRVCRHLMV